MSARTRDPQSLLPLTAALLHVLLSLADSDKHGYAIIKEVQDRTNGEVTLGAGTLYSMLKRLLADGLVVESGDRPDRSTRRRAPPLLPSDPIRPRSGDRRHSASRIIGLASRQNTSWTGLRVGTSLTSYGLEIRASVSLAAAVVTGGHAHGARRGDAPNPSRAAPRDLRWRLEAAILGDSAARRHPLGPATACRSGWTGRLVCASGSCPFPGIRGTRS